MMYASLRGNGLKNNEIFNLKSELNRDNCFEPYFRLKNRFLESGIILNTADLNHSITVDFELHQDFQVASSSKKNYLLMFETDLILPANGKIDGMDHYRRVFTWRDDLLDEKYFIKINFPNQLSIPIINDFQRRDKFCCLIAGNKSIRRNDPRNLYPERISAIRWFEANAKGDFDLYGPGWKLPAKRSGVLGRAVNLLYRLIYPHLNLTAFPSYRGMLKNKSDALLHTRFAICYENVRDLPGYITEKIFDCFLSGCVPVYWGASNIDRYIPSKCFIDRRNFRNTEEVYRYIKNIDESEYIEFQKNIVSFLGSEAAIQFGADFFAETVVNAVVEDCAS